MSSADDSLSVPPISGFSIAKNATLHEYPIEVAYRSALPLCEELVVNVGDSDDDTAARIRSLESPKLRVFGRGWPEPAGDGLLELSGETNRAMDRCRHDWALYLQADEVLHEDDYPALRAALGRAAADPRVEGLLFDYLHFYGSPEWVLGGRRSYRREVRIVRRSSGIRSVSDAQGFRVDGRRPRVIRSGARVFHYGYVKSRDALARKRRLWARRRRGEGRDAGEGPSGRSGDGPRSGREEPDAEIRGYRRHGGLRRFEGSHPAPARAWTASGEWPFDPEEAEPPELDLRELKVRVSDFLQRLTGRRWFEHRTYRLLD